MDLFMAKPVSRDRLAAALQTIREAQAWSAFEASATARASEPLRQPSMLMQAGGDGGASLGAGSAGSGSCDSFASLSGGLDIQVCLQVLCMQRICVLSPIYKSLAMCGCAPAQATVILHALVWRRPADTVLLGATGAQSPWRPAGGKEEPRRLHAACAPRHGQRVARQAPEAGQAGPNAKRRGMSPGDMRNTDLFIAAPLPTGANKKMHSKPGLVGDLIK